MNKIFISIIVILLIVGGIFLFKKNAMAPTSQTQNQKETTSTGTEETEMPKITKKYEATETPDKTDVSEETITLTQSGFSPAELTITAGTKVTWINKSGDTARINSDPHPIHTAYPPLNLGTFSNGETLSLQFDKPGTYGYHDHLNPSLTGKIIVQ